MKRFYRIFAFAALCGGLLAGCRGEGAPVSEEDALLKELMGAIDSAAVYRARKEATIEAKRRELKTLISEGKGANNAEVAEKYLEIGGWFGSYIADSCVYYVDKAAETALKAGDMDIYQKCRFTKASCLMRTGYFKEAELILAEQDPSSMTDDNKVTYYRMQADLYHALYHAAEEDAEFRQYFVDRYSAYRDTFMTLVPPMSYQWIREAEKIAGRSGNFEEALAYNDRRLSMLPPGETRRLAGVLFDRHTIYRFYMGRPIGDHVEYLLQSAIYDVRNAAQDIASMRFVEVWLIQKNDVESAKKVADYYYATMARFGSRMRLLDAQETIMHINEEYLQMISRQKRLTRLGLMAIVILSVILAGILYIVLRSRRRVLSLNEKLDRSNKAARSYVIGFFNLYSSYISRLQSLRSKINVNLRRGNTDFILSLTDPDKDISGEELKQMYSNFDAAFLDIFPNFVESFNSLLRPDENIVLKNGERLNMELRIFAVIKLGITDTTRISELLHCSVKTVYNKRSEINQKLAVPRDKFIEALAGI